MARHGMFQHLYPSLYTHGHIPLVSCICHSGNRYITDLSGVRAYGSCLHLLTQPPDVLVIDDLSELMAATRCGCRAAPCGAPEPRLSGCCVLSQRACLCKRGDAEGLLTAPARDAIAHAVHSCLRLAAQCVAAAQVSNRSNSMPSVQPRKPFKVPKRRLSGIGSFFCIDPRWLILRRL